MEQALRVVSEFLGSDQQVINGVQNAQWLSTISKFLSSPSKAELQVFIFASEGLRGQFLEGGLLYDSFHALSSLSWKASFF